MSLAFSLPDGREAHVPPEARGLARDGVRMLVSDQETGTHRHHRFVDIAEILRSGDLLVVNDSATIPAALDAVREDGSAFALHLSNHIAQRLWLVEPRKVARVRPGERFGLAEDTVATVLAPYRRDESRLWYAAIENDDVGAFMARNGRPIAYGYVEGAWPIETYQTIFARIPGSAEMPSAGRPFSLRVVDRLGSHGIDIATITLHCGIASFEAGELPANEWYAVSNATVRAVESAKRRGGRVICVGTTVVRALESAVDAEDGLRAGSGWTGLIVDRSHVPAIADGILTGFHEPRASHLAMLDALVGESTLEAAYDAALDGNYLWHEFGDTHLLVRAR